MLFYIYFVCNYPFDSNTFADFCLCFIFNVLTFADERRCYLNLKNYPFFVPFLIILLLITPHYPFAEDEQRTNSEQQLRWACLFYDEEKGQ